MPQSILAGIAAWVESNGALSALLAVDSPATDWRVYVGSLPQNPTYPALVINRISDNSDTLHDAIVGMRRARVQFDFYATTVDAVESAMETLLTELAEDEAGVFGSFTEVVVTDEGENPVSDFDTEDTIAVGKVLTNVSRRSRDFMFLY